ncbi:MAG: hypothetical protein WCT77_02120 [Bacteroidota bacterium]
MILIIIILSGILLRLYNLPNIFYYAIDEEKGLYIIDGIAHLSHFPLAGPPSSIGFRLGPLLYYLLAPLYRIPGGFPLTWGYLSIFLSAVTMILIYCIGAKIGKKTGVIALILYAFSYLVGVYESRGWQLSFHPLFVLTVFYCLWKLKEHKAQYFYLLITTLVIASQAEVATLLLIPFTIMVVIINHISIPRKTLIIGITAFLFLNSGIFVFDLRHNFLNSEYLLNYFRPSSQNRTAKNIPLVGTRSVYLAHNLIPNTLSRILYPGNTENIAVQYANCPNYLKYKQDNVPTWLNLLTLAIIIFFLYMTIKDLKKPDTKTFFQKNISMFTILVFAGIAVYTYFFHGEMAEYYLIMVFPCFILMTASVINNILSTKFRYSIIIILALFLGLNGYFRLRSNNPYGLENKMNAVRYIESVVNKQPFELLSFQTCWYSGGYRYLFTKTQNEPVVTYMDNYLSEYYTPNRTLNPIYEIILLTPELIDPQPPGYEEYKSKIAQESEFHNTFGAIEVYGRKIPQQP